MGQLNITTEDRHTPPQDDEIEISLFGPGYGESILLHIGDNKWVIVDSCIEQASQKPAALNYLDSLGIDYRSAVKLIVATHWHDDHIRGIGTIVDECLGAEFVCSSAYNNKEFYNLLAVHSSRKTNNSNTGICEFISVFNTLQERNRPPVFAVANRTLWTSHQTSSSTTQCEITSLSPSDEEIQRSLASISSLLPQENDHQHRLPSPTPNNTAVTLWVNINGDVFALLGSDLEETENENSGWSIIAKSTCKPHGKASIFKVPHHGSQNGHSQQVWDKMLDNNPYALLTPFNRGQKLPSSSDIDRLLSLTDETYITANHQRVTQKPDNRFVRKMVSKHTKYLIQAEPLCGQIRLRKKLTTKGSEWVKSLFAGAGKLQQ